LTRTRERRLAPRWRLPQSLRWRLTVWVAAVLLVSAAAVFAVVYRQTGSQLQGQIERQIRSDASELHQTLQALAPRNATELATEARTYVSSQGYSAGSTLFFTLIPGQRTVTNHPEVFGDTFGEPNETAADQAREYMLGRALLRTRPGLSTRQVPDVGPVRIYAERARLGGVDALLAVGEPLSVVENAQHSVARTFVLAGVIALVIALLASYLAGARVSAPLRRMAAVAARVDAGDLGPRMEARDARADEVLVLAESFNHMLDRLQEAFAAQRAFIADASHELRTPLTVIRGQLEVLAAEEAPSAEEVRRVEALVQAEISRTSRLVDDLLLLVQAERADFLRPAEIDLPDFVRELWEGLVHLASRRFELGPVPAGTLSADPDRLAQALRNLARNAIDHTEPDHGLVRLEISSRPGGWLAFSVLDDGPGIPAGERARVFERFHRTDASRARIHGGTGLGLAIVRAIAEAHGGRAGAGPAGPGGGACVEIVVPGFRPA
jgi:two-component system OmpR family sensor kinase